MAFNSLRLSGRRLVPRFNFTLAAGAAETPYGDIKITGNLKATPVPLPASFWLLRVFIDDRFHGNGSRRQA